MIQLEKIAVAELLPGATPFDDTNVNPVYKGMVGLPNGDDLPAFIKFIDRRAILIESLCAIIGRGLNLPIPTPVLVIVPDDANPSPSYTHDIAFASLDAGYPSIRKLVTVQQQVDRKLAQPIMERLAKWKHLARSVVFDEYIANTDRQIGNLLYDGLNDFVLIDHERCLADHLTPEQIAHPNNLASYLPSDELGQHRSIKEILQTHLPDYAKLPYNLLAEKVHSDLYSNDTHTDKSIRFLQDRIHYITDIIQHRLGFTPNQQALSYEFPG